MVLGFEQGCMELAVVDFVADRLELADIAVHFVVALQ